MKIKRAERILLAVGLALLALWVAARLHRVIGSEVAMARFEAGQTAKPSVSSTAPGPTQNSPVDFRLWSAQRISAYENSLAVAGDVALAILRIPKINLEVPVFNGTEDLTLNRGVGRILGTARVGEPGNLGIAGHRDGFFRGLQSITPGDELELVRRGGEDRYTVTQIRIVTPEDTSVLNPTAVPTLTLVTCFPFYFVGNAPKRYIVTAQLDNIRQFDSVVGGDPGSSKTRNNEEKK